MLLILLLITLFSLFFLHIIFHTYTKHAKYNFPPGPKGLPLIGNLLQFEPSAPHRYFSNLAKIYGPILALRFGSKPAVVIQSASLAKEVFTTHDNSLCSRPILTGLQKLSYNGLDIAFAPYNQHHTEIRKLSIVHLFNPKKVQSFSPIREEEVSRMIQNITSTSNACEVVNLTDLLMTLTSSIICRVGFGKRYEDGVENNRFQQLLNEAQYMFTAFFFSDYIPLVGGWLDKLTGLSSRLEKAFTDLDRFYDEIINDHLDPNRTKGHGSEDIVDVLLQHRDDSSLSSQLTVDKIKALCMNIIAAGTDTSSAMVVWAMTELIKNPTAMKKAQDELRNSVQGKNFVEEEDIPNLKYLKAVVKETFRLHPATPLLVVREAINKCTIQGYDILPGTLVFVNVWHIGRDPTSWKHPEYFIPERFMESSIDFKGHDFELIPFGAGRRICPGMLLGVVTMEVALANLLYAFDWEVPVGSEKEVVDVGVNPGITMHKKNPLCLVAKKYSQC